MQPFSLLIKPVGGRCNLSCAYCFYLSHPGGEMPGAVMARLLETYCALPFRAKSIALQGGEPLLANSRILDAVEARGGALERSLQTNATLIGRDTAHRLARGGWLVGASVDGPPDVHNAVRSGSFTAAERGIRNLEAEGVDYNLLTVVSKANVSRPEETYLFLRDSFSTKFHQYIECTGPNPALAISGEEWGEFLVRLFDEWAKKDVHTVSIRLFDSIVSQILRGYPTQCSFADTCRQYLVVEHDGSVYPCDFHVRDDLKLGNIMENTWEELLSSPIYERFAAAKLANLPEKCKNCEYFAFCRGDCPRNRQSLCTGWRRFFAHALPRLREILSF